MLRLKTNPISWLEANNLLFAAASVLDCRSRDELYDEVEDLRTGGETVPRELVNGVLKYLSDNYDNES